MRVVCLWILSCFLPPTLAGAGHASGSPTVFPDDGPFDCARWDETFDRVESWVKDIGGLKAEPRVFGFSIVTGDDDRASIDSLLDETNYAVVLIHGLDDPGWIWKDVSTPLRDAAHTVLRFEYPNDQPIAASANVLADRLRDLKARGVDRISIVAHSMGGLVARDVLTRAEHYNCDGEGGERFPAIDRLIMVGTPNHGTSMAHMRRLGEWRENVVRFFREGIPIEGNIDGHGEAATDLLPDSDFLTGLNGRGQPAHTRYTLIAGRISPVSDVELDAFTDRVRDAFARSILSKSITAWFSDDVAVPAIDILRSATHGIGDGLVPVDSVQLHGVPDFVVVGGNHMSIIANLFDSSDRTPPALPIILDRLGDS